MDGKVLNKLFVYNFWRKERKSYQLLSIVYYRSFKYIFLATPLYPYVLNTFLYPQILIDFEF